MAFDENAYIANAFERCIALLDANSKGWSYNLLTKNCQHAANCVVAGKNEMQQLPTPRRVLSWLTGYQAPDQDVQERTEGIIYL